MTTRQSEAWQATAALLVVDVQNGFMPGGGLPVPDGDAVVPVINRLAPRFDNVVVTQDWHPADHVSFAANHPGRQPFETITLPYGEQVLWPVHCVAGSEDAALHPALSLPQAQLIIRKGFHREVDSYSAFTEADRSTTTGLAAYLSARGIRQLFICGLATDYCVAWTALDARAAGFEAWVIEDACRGIDLDGSLARAWAAMDEAGVGRACSDQLTEILSVLAPSADRC
ncbi:MAG: bifunctional nicotinamidase/pyrazinamidase [Lautropia sp.]|nr:bifunctional nicotinamidase/pyrazinamidase [Lautropia sp.]